MENPERIAQIVGKWLGGGVEAVVMNYYRHIDKTKYQFDFICDEDSKNIPCEEIEKLGGRVIIVPPYQKLFKYIKVLQKVYKDGKYNIVHSNLNTLSVFPLYAAKKAGVPIRMAHSHSSSSKKEFKRHIAKSILKHFSKIYATHYLCCSEIAGRYQFGNRTYNKGKVRLVKNAIDLERFSYSPELRAKKRAELEISENTFVVGHVGRFVSVKNHSFLLDIFNEIHKEKPDSILLLAGTGPLLEEVQEKADKLGLNDCVRFLGQRSDANELYQVFDTVILPSLYEGLVVVLVEAQCAGLPCFCSSEVSPETKISDNLTFIPLSESADKWAKIVLDKTKDFSRTTTTESLRKKGYDICVEAGNLEKLYSEALSNLVK